jgi:hypothetical protein
MSAKLWFHQLGKHNGRITLRFARKSLQNGGADGLIYQAEYTASCLRSRRNREVGHDKEMTTLLFLEPILF